MLRSCRSHDDARDPSDVAQGRQPFIASRRRGPGGARPHMAPVDLGPLPHDHGRFVRSAASTGRGARHSAPVAGFTRMRRRPVTTEFHCDGKRSRSPRDRYAALYEWNADAARADRELQDGAGSSQTSQASDGRLDDLRREHLGGFLVVDGGGLLIPGTTADHAHRLPGRQPRCDAGTSRSPSATRLPRVGRTRPFGRGVMTRTEERLCATLLRWTMWRPGPGPDPRRGQRGWPYSLESWSTSPSLASTLPQPP